MEHVKDLRDLLAHEILDLLSAEEQIIEGLPKMIEKAGNPKLKEALTMHLDVTKRQKTRLETLKTVMSGKEKEGFFISLFGKGVPVKCRGTEGLIEEAEKMLGQNMSAETRDAAIIGAAQKIEHYEISAYGTARTYARELGLDYVAAELEKTLQEEYDANDSLTDLAVTRINLDAEKAKMK